MGRASAACRYVMADEASKDFEHPLRRFLDRLVNSELAQIVIGLLGSASRGGAA